MLGYNITPQAVNSNGVSLLQSPLGVPSDPTDSQANQTSTSKPGSQFLLNNVNHLKSLNMPYKKKEAYRIDDENQRMIERITQVNTSIPVKKLEREY